MKNNYWPMHPIVLLIGVILVLSIVFLFSSCSSSSKLKRAEKLIKKAELLGAKWYTDTIYINTPIPIPEIKTDTIFVSEEGDTVYITKDKLKITYINLPGDSIFIEGKCEADTIYKEIPTTIIKTIEAKCTPWWRWVLIGMVLMLVVAILLKLITK